MTTSGGCGFIGREMRWKPVMDWEQMAITLMFSTIPNFYVSCMDQTCEIESFFCCCQHVLFNVSESSNWRGR